MEKVDKFEKKLLYNKKWSEIVKILHLENTNQAISKLL